MNPNDLHHRLTSQNPPPEDAISELRSLILKGLTKSLDGRAGADSGFIEDMTQESLIKILEKLHTFENRSQFSSWVFSIAIRTAFSALRRKHWGDVSLDQLREEKNSPEDDHTTTSSVAQNEIIAELHELIRTKLTPRQRDVIFAEINGMPQDEIATQLNSSRNAIYKVGHDARKKLRQELGILGITLANLRTL